MCTAACSYRDDCKKLAHFVHRVEAFLMETEEEADMSGPGWQAAFSVSNCYPTLVTCYLLKFKNVPMIVWGVPYGD